MVRNPMKKGFTLIELLVTISIIAVLSTIGLTIFSGVQSKARDSTRKQDLNKLATALEIYFQNNSQFITSQNQTCNSTDTNTFYTAITPYISGVVPKDPKTGTQYCYFSENNGQSFRLFAKLENCSDKDIISGINCQTAAWNYSIVSENLIITPAP